MTSELSLARWLATFTRHLRISSLGDFYRLCFDYFGLSLILTGFNIGQEKLKMSLFNHYYFYR